MENSKSNSLEWVKAVVVAVVVAFSIRYFLFAPIVVDGQSMMPTLEHSDRMIVNKIGYAISEPKRFDIIVFHAPGGKDYIKRIIGLPGDHIEYKNDQLFVNGEAIAEPYLDELKAFYSNDFVTRDFDLAQTIGSQIIPDDHLFVLGDNRHNSLDSRDIGVVHKDEVIGKANVVFWPFVNIGIVE
ncbi:signal peptidase I [Bacillus sp. FJAT-45037]|uniref:signal peptidase I n=1 Tax=Bacillus sp. FJAT-45037 TaxID=2011007 RepID=UPI000C2516F2|nr:signal peptidase I [Bacillus sp. FJAT-45037]